MNNWLRTYTIRAGMAGSEGFEISDDGYGRAIHVSFDLEKTDTQASNTGKVQIWNLSDAHKGILKEKNAVMEIRAGYGEKNYPLFIGTIANTTESIDNSDRMIEIELTEGRESYQTVSSVSLSGAIPCISVVNVFLKDMGIQSSIFTQTATSLLNSTKYDNGYAYIGKSKEGLTQVCDKCGLKWSLQNQVLQIYAPNESISTRVYVLNVNSGLIDIPKKITLKINDADVAGYEVNYLMNGAIGVNDYIKLESKELDGYYRVHNIKINGDNYDGDWICTAQVVEVNR